MARPPDWRTTIHARSDSNTILTLRGVLRMTASTRSFRHAVRASTLLVAAAIAGCTDTPTAPVAPPIPENTGRMAVYASFDGSSATTLVIQVSGPGILKADRITPDTLSFNIAVTGTVATGSILVPAGSARVVTARAYAGLVETHRGSITADIVEGVNPTLNISMIPLAGDVPISVTVGTTLVIVRPSLATLAVGDTLRMTAEVRDRDGAIVPGAKARWASLNPSRAMIDTLGLVTMRDTGEVQIVATYGTVGGSGKVTGRSVLPTSSFQLTWNGVSSRRWTDSLNWTPAGIGAQRVPTATDSVVIPAGTPFSPRLECVDGNVNHLVVEAGASIAPYCGSAINVYGTAISRGVVERVNMRPGSRIGGVFNNVYVYGDSVRLLDSLRTGYLEINAATAQLRLNGKRLVVNGSLYIGAGTMPVVAGDTLYLNGDVNWSGGDHNGLITGGVVFFRGTSFTGYQYFASGTNRLVFDRTATGKQTLYSMDYLSAPLRAQLRVWDVRSAEGATICAYVKVTDSLVVTSSAPTLPVDMCSSYRLRSEGPVVADSKVQITGYQWELMHVTGTSLVQGSWSPAYTDIYAPSALVKPGLAYQNLRYYASNTVQGNMTISGYLYVEGATTELDLAKRRMNVGGYLQLATSATLKMVNPEDTLWVDGYASMTSDVHTVQEPKMTAGVLRIGGYFDANGFSATGTHKVILNGATGSRYIYSMNYESRASQGFQDLEIADGATYCVYSRVRVKGTIRVKASSTLNNVCGSGYLRVDGDIVTEPLSIVEPYLVAVNTVKGTQNVAGAWSPVYTDFNVANAKVNPALSYQNLRFYASDSLLGNTSASGQLLVQGDGVELNLGGRRMNVAGQLDVTDGATLKMVAPLNADTLWVDGYANFAANVSGIQDPKLTAGVLRVGGYFTGYGFSASQVGTHKVLLTGPSGSRYINSMNYESRPSQGFRDLEIASGATYCVYERARVKGTLRVRATGVVSNPCGGYVRIDGDLVTEATSSVEPYNVALYNPTGTQNVLGAFQPTYTSIHDAAVLPKLKGGLGYQNMNIYVGASLTDSLPVNGDLNLSGTGVNLTLNGKRVRVSGTFNLDANATVTMTNALDSLDLRGPVYWDGGGDHNGKLTDGTVLMSGPTFYGPNFYGTGAHRTVFNRTIDPVRVQMSSGDPNSSPFNDVEVRDKGVRLECNLFAAGNVLVRSGSKIDAACGSNLYVAGTLTTETLSAVTNGPTFPGSQNLTVWLKNASGTSLVSGTYDPAGTVFQALNASIKPTLGYRYVRLDRSTSFLGNTSINGQLDIINDGTIVALAGKKVEVKDVLNFDNTAKLKMDQPGDTILVATTNPAADFYWDGGSEGVAAECPGGCLTNGVVIYYGDRFYGPQYKATAGTPHKFVFASDAGGVAISVEGTPEFANVEMKGLRSISLNSSALVQDSLNITAPTTLFGSALTMTGGSRLMSVAGSDLRVNNVRLDNPSGTKFVSGGFNPSATTYFGAPLGAAGAIKPGLRYTHMQIEGDYALADTTTVPGNLDITGASALLKMSGKRLRVGGTFDVTSGGRLTMDAPGDSLDVGSNVRFYSAAVSTLSAGAIVVRGDYFQFAYDFSGATGTHRVVFAGTGAGTQTLYASSTGARNLRNLEIVGSRSVNLQSAAVTGTTTISSAAAVSGYNVYFNGPVTSAAGSSLAFSNTTQFDDPSGTNLIAGSYASTGTTVFTGTGAALKVGAGMTYLDLEVRSSTSIVGGALTGARSLTVSAPGTLTLPAGSTLTGGNINVDGTLNFAGGFVAPSTLVVRSGGTAKAMGTGASDAVDFTTIIAQTGGTLDNSVSSGPGNGFRYKSPGGSLSLAAGTLVGPSPATHP